MLTLYAVRCDGLGGCLEALGCQSCASLHVDSTLGTAPGADATGLCEILRQNVQATLLYKLHFR